MGFNSSFKGLKKFNDYLLFTGQQVAHLHDIYDDDERLFLTKHYLLKKYVNFRVAVTEMYPRILWKMVADPLGSVDHTLGTSGTDEFSTRNG